MYLPKRVLAILAGMACASVIAAPAATDAVQVEPMTAPAERVCPTVELQVPPFEVTTDFSRTFKGLAEIRGGFGLRADSYEDVGMVVTTRIVDVRPPVEGAECKSWTVTAGYTPATLYVASQLKRNECAFSHVLHHEQHHVEIYTTALEELRGARGEQLLAKAGVLVQDPSLSYKEVQHRVHALFDGFLSEVRARHDAFDSPEEYELNGTVCSGAIRRMLKSQR